MHAYYETKKGDPAMIAYRRARSADPEVKARRKAWDSTPERIEARRAWDRKREATEERKAYSKARAQRPAVKARNSERTRAMSRSDQRRNMYYGARSRAAARGLPFDLKIEDIIVPTHCPVLGIPLAVSSTISNGSPTLDRIVPALGYVRGNVNVISFRANTLRRDASADELAAVLAYAREIEALTS